MKFGQFARMKREEAGLSQDDVAKALGLDHRSTVSRKEAGQLEWSLNDLLNLAEVLNIPASELMKEWLSIDIKTHSDW